MVNKQQQVPTNCFQPIPVEDLAPQLPPVTYDKTQEIYVLVPYSKMVDEDPEHIVLEYKPVLKEKRDICEYINSFADDVGIQNILKKMSISGDTSLLNQTGREPLNENGGLEPIQDFSNVPKNKTEAFNAVLAGVNAFDELPADLKGKMSLSQFAQLFGQNEFDNYIKSIIDKQANNGGDNNG